MTVRDWAARVIRGPFSDGGAWPGGCGGAGGLIFPLPSFMDISTYYIVSIFASAYFCFVVDE